MQNIDKHRQNIETNIEQKSNQDYMLMSCEANYLKALRGS